MSDPKTYIGVVHLRHAQVAQAHGFCAFSHGKEAPLRKLNDGDQFLFYSPKEGHEGVAVQAFTGLGTVTGKAPTFGPFPTMDVEAWQRAARYESVSHIPVRPLLESLSFVKSPRNWGMAFRRSFFEITREDFNRIAAPMREQ